MAAPKSMRRLPDRHEADPRWLAKIEARFWARVAKTDDLFACWEWTAGKFDCGYGAFGIGRNNTHYANRISWWLATGRWPGDLWVLHRCDNRGCVRPDHLFLGDHVANMRDMIAKGRAGYQKQPERWAEIRRETSAHAAKTHCPQGHEYTPENTDTWNGGRKCRECGRQRCRRYDAAHREIINARQNERRAANRETEQAKARERYAANAEAMRLKAREYKANKRAAAGSEYLR